MTSVRAAVIFAVKSGPALRVDVSDSVELCIVEITRVTCISVQLATGINLY